MAGWENYNVGGGEFTKRLPYRVEALRLALYDRAKYTPVVVNPLFSVELQPNDIIDIDWGTAYWEVLEEIIPYYLDHRDLENAANWTTATIIAAIGDTEVVTPSTALLAIWPNQMFKIINMLRIVSLSYTKEVLSTSMEYDYYRRDQDFAVWYQSSTWYNNVFQGLSPTYTTDLSLSEYQTNVSNAIDGAAAVKDWEATTSPIVLNSNATFEYVHLDFGGGVGGSFITHRETDHAKSKWRINISNSFDDPIVATIYSQGYTYLNNCLDKNNSYSSTTTKTTPELVGNENIAAGATVTVDILDFLDDQVIAHDMWYPPSNGPWGDGITPGIPDDTGKYWPWVQYYKNKVYTYNDYLVYFDPETVGGFDFKNY